MALLLGMLLGALLVFGAALACVWCQRPAPPVRSEAGEGPAQPRPMTVKPADAERAEASA